ncbi:MAG: hypothetical protein AAB425_05770, partial [Bdellovibrionota bacterium]
MSSSSSVASTADTAAAGSASSSSAASATTSAGASTTTNNRTTVVHDDAPSASTEASAAQLLSGTYVWNSAGSILQGTMSSLGAITLANISVTHGAGYVSSISIDAGADFTAANICTSKSILGTAGSALCTSGGSLSTAATAAQVLTGTEFFNAAGTKSTGTMSNHGAITLSSTSVTHGAGYFSSITLSPGADFAATNICSSKSILGTAGSALCTSGGSLSAAATAAQVLTGTEFFNATGVKSTGTMSNQGTWNVTSSFPGAGYVAAISNAPAAGNICSGTQVIGTAGTAVCQGAAGSGTLALTYALCSGYYGYNSSGTALDGSKTCNDVGTPSTISGLKLWYRADSIANKANAATMEAARDQSSYSNDANVTGTVTYYTGIIGTKPASKSSANGYINYPHATQLDLEHSDPFSIVLAMRTGSAFNAWEWIVNKQQASGEYNGWYFFTGSSNTQKLGFAYERTGGSGASYVSHANSTTALTTSTNYIAVLTNAGTGTAGFAMYLNGTAETMVSVSDGGTTSSIKASVPVKIGDRGD